MSNSSDPPSPTHPIPTTKTSSASSISWPSAFLIFSVLGPMAIALLIYQLDPLDPAPLPLHELTQRVTAAATRNAHMLKGSEFVGAGALVAPEDVAYDSKSGLIYTGCADGWSAADSVVENWVFIGGRPLGLAHGHENEVFVADAEKSRVLCNVTLVMIKLHSPFVFFLGENYVVLFMSPSKTSPHLSFLQFHNMHKSRRRCRKYYLQGSKKGSVENFIDHLPGMPDNIRYDGEGQYWIALTTEVTPYWDLALRYPFIRKVLVIVKRYAAGKPHLEKNAGAFAVNLNGEPTAHYSDPELVLITSGIKIGNYLYCGSTVNPYIIRLDVHQHPAHPTT
ncbi:hypothetical protein GBA52_025930 [Prunus armeniaca]|nr:hypothetical protein GBA52_025930 [Prunus armeniaca]